MGTAALHEAVWGGHWEVSELLLAARAVANLLSSPKWGCTSAALHLCAERGKVEGIEILCAHGADVEATDGDGDRALHLAAYGDNKTQCTAC